MAINGSILLERRKPLLHLIQGVCETGIRGMMGELGMGVFGWEGESMWAEVWWYRWNQGSEVRVESARNGMKSSRRR